MSQKRRALVSAVAVVATMAAAYLTGYFFGQRNAKAALQQMDQMELKTGQPPRDMPVLPGEMTQPDRRGKAK